MNDIHIVTYATHAEGYYNELMKNNLVKNLGWGKKWNGFKDKFIAIEKYTRDLVNRGNKNDIIIFIDGFDTKINKNLDMNKIVEKFYNIVGNEGGILMSNDPLLINSAANIFGTCNNNCIANTGLYMGNALQLNKLLKESLEYKCKDDQVILNQLCEKYNVKIDFKNEIFENLDLKKKLISESFFVQTPGQTGYYRYYRALFEYSQFFLIYITIIYTFLVYLIVCRNKKNKNYIILVSFLLFILFYKKIDKSCI